MDSAQIQFYERALYCGKTGGFGRNGNSASYLNEYKGTKTNQNAPNRPAKGATSTNNGKKKCTCEGSNKS